MDAPPPLPPPPPSPVKEPGAPSEHAVAAHSWWRHPSVLYPERYVWYVLTAVLDIVVTVTVLVHYGAKEVNSIAQASIELFGTWGLVGLKFLTLVIVVAICEYVGRKHDRLGRILATIAVILSLMPVLAATSQVFWLWGHGSLQYTTWPKPAADSFEDE